MPAAALATIAAFSQIVLGEDVEAVLDVVIHAFD